MFLLNIAAVPACKKKQPQLFHLTDKLFFYLSTWFLTFANFNNCKKETRSKPLLLHLMEKLCPLFPGSACSSCRTDRHPPACLCRGATSKHCETCPVLHSILYPTPDLRLADKWEQAAFAWGSCPRCWNPPPQELTVILAWVCPRWTYKTWSFCKCYTTQTCEFYLLICLPFPL